MNEYRIEEFRRLGFYCLRPTKVRFSDGSELTVKAHGFRDSKMLSEDDATQIRECRIYEVKRKEVPGVELVTEPELESLMGLEEFGKLK